MASISQPDSPTTHDSPRRQHRQIPVERLTDQLETPSLDDRSYRVIRLPNQLEVLLVHDATTDKASAAMDVNVGNFSDEDDIPGMAHAVEHLLFMGTKKYPVENAYSSYLSSHSGYSNAYTAATSTNYYFEIAAHSEGQSEIPEASDATPLYGALDRFAQFFIEPLFLPETLDRELRAVDSENKKNLQSDQWRLHQLDKTLTNPKHPYCHFSTGSLDTLKTQPEARGLAVREKFMEFHDKHYSANRMKLVILGREPLDTLEVWAADLFAGIKNKDLKQNRWETEKPYRESELLTQIFAKPVMESRTLELFFPFLDEENMYESQPSRYISHLIGHEGPGSIMAYIKAKGWANGLSAGGYDICPGSPGIFTAHIRLTPEGLKNYKEVVKVFFQYVSLLREAPPQEWIFAEQKGMADVDFKFKQKTPASKFTSKISSVMQKPLPREWLLSGASRLRKFAPDLITKGLECLRPDNFRLLLVSQELDVEFDKQEKWYGTEYKYEKIPQDFIAELEKAASVTASQRLPELHLPHKNQFIPTKLEVEKKDVKEPARAPTLIRNDELMRAWYKKDDTFWVPKANFYVTLRNVLPSATAENSLKARLYTDLVRDALEEYSYDAELAGLEYGVSSYSGGIDIQVGGYNDKLRVLLEKVLVTMRDLEIGKERFEIVKERLTRGLRNWDYQQPYSQVGDFTRWLTKEKGFINDEILAELPQLTAKDIQEYFPHLLRQVHLEVFVHGNVYKEDALLLTDLVEKTLKPRALPQAQWPIRRSLLFPPGGSYVYKRTLRDPANVNHCIEYFLHVGDKADRLTRAKVLLFDQVTHEPAFDQLRTKEQLGYVVFSGARTTSTTIGFRFLIQSERHPDYLETRVDAFLNTFSETLTNMSETEFEGHKRALISKRLEKMKNLDQESGALWNHIDSEYFDFELPWEDAAAVKTLTKKDMIDFFAQYISPFSPQRAKLSVQLIAQASSSKDTPLSGQAERLSTVVSKLVTAEGASPQPTALQERLSSLSSTDATHDGVVAIVKSHLSEDLKLKQEQIDKVLETGIKLLSLEPETSSVVAEGKAPYVIENVREYKSMLPVSAGPRPVKELSEFEDLDSKL